MRIRVVVALLCVLALAGCVPAGPPGPDTRVDLKPADVIGAWKDSRRGGVLVFTDAGFSGDDLGYMFLAFPEDLPAGFDSKRDRAAGAGRWELGPALADPDGPHQMVRLNFDVIAGRPVRASINKLEGQRRDSAVVLVFYISDPDLNDRVVYTRCPDCATGTPVPTPS